MYIQNETSSWLSFTIENEKFKLEPKGMTHDYLHITEAQAKSTVIEKLLGIGQIGVKDDADGVKKDIASVEAQKEEMAGRKLEVEKVDATVKQINRMVQCAAPKADGTRCSGHVNVKDDEYDENVPYFCHRHRNEDASRYEKVSDGWVRREAE